jgi:hypothetical protein
MRKVCEVSSWVYTGLFLTLQIFIETVIKAAGVAEIA